MIGTPGPGDPVHDVVALGHLRAHVGHQDQVDLLGADPRVGQALPGRVLAQLPVAVVEPTERMDSDTCDHHLTHGRRSRGLRAAR